MATHCKSCGDVQETIAWDYCQACLGRHRKGELYLGACKGCDYLDYEAENTDDVPVRAPGATERGADEETDLGDDDA